MNPRSPRNLRLKSFIGFHFIPHLAGFHRHNRQFSPLIPPSFNLPKLKPTKERVRLLFSVLENFSIFRKSQIINNQVLIFSFWTTFKIVDNFSQKSLVDSETLRSFATVYQLLWFRTQVVNFYNTLTTSVGKTF